MWATPAIPKRRQAKTEPRMIFFVFFFMFLIIIIVILNEVKNLECVKVDVYEILPPFGRLNDILYLLR